MTKTIIATGTKFVQVIIIIIIITIVDKKIVIDREKICADYLIIIIMII